MIDWRAMFQALTQEQEAWSLAFALYACLYLLIFQHRLYYVGFLAVVVLAAGSSGLEFAPALWIPVELALGGYKFFMEARNKALGKKDAAVTL